LWGFPMGTVPQGKEIVHKGKFLLIKVFYPS
jgi:hypothetical protein